MPPIAFTRLGMVIRCERAYTRWVKMSFGRTLRELRKQRGISQKQLAEAVGVDFTYLSKIENDRMPPPSEKTIKAMAQVLQADADELTRLAGKIPSDLAETLLNTPEAIQYFRSLQGDIRTRQDWTDLLNKKRANS
ncbi:MAG: XRE family transcriptional regulator [Chloroflexota bacterium]|nr:MAG: XRE family transcriptional regulator [Chloroflexota bacterium]